MSDETKGKEDGGEETERSKASTLPPSDKVVFTCDDCGPLAESQVEREEDTGQLRCKKCLARRLANERLQSEQAAKEEQARIEREEAAREERERQAEQENYERQRKALEEKEERDRLEVRAWELAQKGHGKRVRVKSSHPQSQKVTGVVVDVGDKGLVVSLGGQIAYLLFDDVEDLPEAETEAPKL